MASVEPAPLRLQPRHVKLEVERVAERVVAIRVRLDDPHRGDKELEKILFDDGLELLTAFALVRGDFYCVKPYTSATMPLDRPFQKKYGVCTVLEETSLGLLLDEVSGRKRDWSVLYCFSLSVLCNLIHDSPTRKAE